MVLLDGQFCETTFNNYRKTFTTFLSWCVKQKYILVNPMVDIDILDVPDRKILFLTKAEVRNQLDGIDWFVKESNRVNGSNISSHKESITLETLVATYIFAGLRLSEALWLMREDVDLESRTIYIRDKIVDGRKWQVKRGRGKKSRNRDVPISDTLFPYLEKQLRQHDFKWVFPSPTGNLWSSGNFSKKLRCMQKQLVDHGYIEKRWSCKDFRHTFGTLCAMNGMSDLEVAEVMDNSPEICRKHYINMATKYLRKKVDFMMGQNAEA